MNSRENQPESLRAMCWREEGAACIPGERAVVPLETTACLGAEARAPSARGAWHTLQAGGGGTGHRGSRAGSPRAAAVPGHPAPSCRCAACSAARGGDESDVRWLGRGRDGFAPSAEPQRSERQRGMSLALWCGCFIVSPSCL